MRTIVLASQMSMVMTQRLEAAPEEATNYHLEEDSVTYEAEFALLDTGNYNISVSLEYPDKVLAMASTVFQSQAEMDEYYCGRALPALSIVVHHRCTSGNVPGRWVARKKGEPGNGFMPRKDVASFLNSRHEWVPNGGCRLHWYEFKEAVALLEGKGWEEILFLGDSR